MRGTLLFEGLYNKDPTIWSTRLGPPYFRKPPYDIVTGLRFIEAHVAGLGLRAVGFGVAAGTGTINLELSRL